MVVDHTVAEVFVDADTMAVDMNRIEAAVESFEAAVERIEAAVERIVAEVRTDFEACTDLADFPIDKCLLVFRSR